MKHYKDPNTNEIYAYESDGSQDAYIKSHLVLISNTDLAALRIEQQQAYEASLTYSQKRVAEYPSIGDQLDALFHAGVFPSDMAAQIQAIKDKYPKA